jgi:hypothetical protein
VRRVLNGWAILLRWGTMQLISVSYPQSRGLPPHRELVPADRWVAEHLREHPTNRWDQAVAAVAENEGKHQGKNGRGEDER